MWSKGNTVAQIIECPACSTRYKINKAIPEGGRNVKCARCAHQWKLTPEDALPDEDILPDEERADNTALAQAEQQWHAQSEASGADYDDSASVQADDASDQPHAHYQHDTSAYDENAEASADEEDWTPPQNDSRAPMSPLNQPVTPAYDDPETDVTESPVSEEEIAARQGKRSWWQRGQPSPGPDAGSGQAYPIPSGAYEVPSEVYGDEDAPLEHVVAPDRPETEETSAPIGDENWSSRFMGPGWRAQKAAPSVEEEEDEDPETVIRETFRSALERPDEEEHVAAASTAEEVESSSPYGSIYDAEWNRSGDEDEEIHAARGPESELHQQQAFFEDGSEAVPFAASARNEIETDQDGDPAFYSEEEAADEETPGFLRRGLGAGEPDTEETYYSEPQDYDDAIDDEDDQEADRATIGRFAPQNGRPQAFGMDEEREEFNDEPNGFASFDEPRDYDALYPDQFDDAAERRIEQSELDEALIGLSGDDRQDDDDQIYGPASQGHSGLAVAAGWVAFLSLMGGLLLGVFNFRQEVMAALPGTVNMYRVLGYEVALNKVDFASVDYKWSEIDGRPAIELRGQVVNITDETVKVPPVLVNVQNTSGTPVKAQASVPTDELGPRDSATFTLELVSPPEDVTQIELEFAPGG